MARSAEQPTGRFRSLRNLRAEPPAIPRAGSAFAEINPVRLLGSEDAVAGVAEAGNDVGGLVEMVVDGARINMYVGVLFGQ